MSYVDGNTTITYTYNEEGIRTSKTITTGNNVTRHDYILSGSQIVRETVYLNNVEQYTLVYFYDENGPPLGMKYRTPTYADGVFDGYIFEKNLQGDIVAIYDLNTNKIVEYKYDAWGNATVEGTQASTIGVINPFRYRGYYFDNEIDLYYIQSRYYNAEWSRFLNVDSYITTGQGLISFNMFAYCLNEPVDRIDINGALSQACYGMMHLPISHRRFDASGGGGLLIAAGLAATGITITAILIDQKQQEKKLALPASKLNIQEAQKTDNKDSFQKGDTYYHITTLENAYIIMCTGYMIGSLWEGGYVFAWRLKPDEYAAENSGAHLGVIISFETTASFRPDPGIADDSAITCYYPVVSTIPGPIRVKNVKIVEIMGGLKCK